MTKKHKPYEGWVKCCFKCPAREKDQMVCYAGKPYDECPKYKNSEVEHRLLVKKKS